MRFGRREVTSALAALVLTGASVAAFPHRVATPVLPPLPGARRTGWAEVNGIEMYYAIYGHARPGEAPVLLIHGGLGSADVWANQVIDLARDHKVIVADSRGHGRSTRTEAPVGYDLMAADYVALLDYLHIPRVALVGWSDGGIIGLDIAMNHPERLTRLFAHAANANVEGLKGPQPTPSTEMTPTLEAQPVLTRSGFVAEIEQMWNSEPDWSADDLAAIRVPTAIVLGDHDEAVRRSHTLYLAETIPGAQLIILPDVGHAAMVEDPAMYNRAIRAFIDVPAAGQHL
jgi:pimeloyl-ACP methyl ester carboxylesterase